MECQRDQSLDHFCSWYIIMISRTELKIWYKHLLTTQKSGESVTSVMIVQVYREIWKLSKCNTWLLHFNIWTNVKSCILTSTQTLHTFPRTTQKSRNWHPRTQEETYVFIFRMTSNGQTNLARQLLPRLTLFWVLYVNISNNWTVKVSYSCTTHIDCAVPKGSKRHFYFFTGETKNWL